MSKIMNDDPLLNRVEAAAYIGLRNPNTLAVWDCTKRHDLQPVKIGTAVRYRKSSLDKYIESRMNR